ncbi:hypothetical protein LJ754_10070 [Arthrobacter sp. zg-Y40]|uniref:hypothetical protein n=1 Tax=Arthrobacter sp. zg-Y40 TaxID=2886939 RepID=UPI001D14E843|nr:hypothetical protein [Arthrobacter sp. zg-Y40]MCC3279500.1 hypothetical protein [Arthrobacter sp. zg-Y40]
MPLTRRKSAVVPSERLIPQIANVWGALAWAFLPAPVVLLIGWSISGALGSGDELVDALGVAAMFLGFANFLRIVMSNRRKVAAAAYGIAVNLHRDYGIAVHRRVALVLMNTASCKLQPDAFDAVDENGRALFMKLGLDTTGTNVVPTIILIDGKSTGEQGYTPEKARPAVMPDLPTRLAERFYNMTEKTVSAEPGENLIPKVPNLNWLLFAMVAVIAGAVVTGIAMDGSTGGMVDFLMILMLAMLLAFVVLFIILMVKSVQVRGKVAAASYRLGESLVRDYGITVTKPKQLILHDKAKPRITPYTLAATDTYGRQLTLTVSTDPTGTRIVPTVDSVDGQPVQTAL